MLSDEEKKAYDNLIMLKYFTVKKEDKQAIDTILNLIEKQSKEIEKKYKQLQEKENIIRKLNLESQQYFETTIRQAEQFDKEIEELKENYDKLTKHFIENHISKAKIQSKIEEWQKEKEFYNKDEDREWGQYNNWDWIDTIINEMQSLL